MQPNPAYNEVSLSDLVSKIKGLIRYFLRKWWLISLIVFAGAGIGVTISMLLKPAYVAELSFALEEKGSGGNLAGIASQFGFDMGGESGAFSGDNSLELIKSRNMVEKTLLTKVNINGVDQLLVNRYIEFSPTCKKWKNKPNIAEVRFEEGEPRKKYTILKDSLLKVISKEIRRENLSVTKFDKKLNVINVKCKIEDAFFAKYFVEILVRNSSDFYIETKTKKSRVNVELLESRVDSVRRALDNELYGAAISKDQNMNAFRAQGNVQAMRKQMNVQVLTTMYGELLKNLELAKFTLMREEPVFQIIDTPILPLDNEKIGKVMAAILGGFIAFIVAIGYLTFTRKTN